MKTIKLACLAVLLIALFCLPGLAREAAAGQRGP